MHNIVSTRIKHETKQQQQKTGNCVPATDAHIQSAVPIFCRVNIRRLAKDAKKLRLFNHNKETTQPCPPYCFDLVPITQDVIKSVNRSIYFGVDC